MPGLVPGKGWLFLNNEYASPPMTLTQGHGTRETNDPPTDDCDIEHLLRTSSCTRNDSRLSHSRSAGIFRQVFCTLP
jgi:hypothetical protein